MRSIEARSVTIVDPGIGGGHHTFGLAVEEALQSRSIESGWYSARQNALDTLSCLYWDTNQAAYHIGSMGGVFTWLYDELREWLARNGGKPPQVVRDRLREVLPNGEGVIIATHAHTAVKPDGARLVLLQGDIVGGKGYAAADANLIVVPEDSSRKELVSYGIDPQKIETVGFFVPAGIKDPRPVPVRLGQLNSEEELHLGIFFTGALPRPHVVLAFQELIPRLSTLMKKGQLKLTVYTFTSDFIGEEFLRLGRELKARTVRNDDDSSDGNWDLRVIYGKTVRKAIERSVAAASDPKNPISILVTMLGERYSWAKYLAVFPLLPINRTNVGQNTQAAIERGYAPPPEATRHLPTILQGNLTDPKERIKRAQAIPTDGAEHTAGIIANLTKHNSPIDF